MMQPAFILLSVITFLSAFLLFQIELIIAKLFLPVYGGSYLVWGACVVFFQAVLMAGYVFAHGLLSRLGALKYLRVHLILLLVPLLFFPGRSLQVENTAGSLLLMADIFIKLLVTIGPVFFVLSTISLVTQSWLASSSMTRKDHPYILYAVSNVGSFAALWTYPFVFELGMTNTEQLTLWRMGYAVLVLLNVAAWRLVKVTGLDHSQPAERTSAVPMQQAIRWLALSAATVTLFLSVSNIFTYEVAPVPLLWIIPLSIYLLSFVLTFKARPWYSKWIYAPGVMVVAAYFYFHLRVITFPALWSILIFSVLLFLLCLYAHHELIRTKPARQNMTYFYVMISLGGFLGGFMTSWIIPLCSRSPVEFLFGLALLAAVYQHKITKIILSLLMIAGIIFDPLMDPQRCLYKKRNYYGILLVYDRHGVRSLGHGTTLHGLQWKDLPRRLIPLGYYSPHSPMGEVFTRDIFKARRIGAVGLGAGTISMYSRPDLPIDFFELDPDVMTIAKDYFWYLKDSPGPVRVAIGDARISLAKSPELNYDVMVIDAFGGDAIPIHLINKDVVQLYRQHLSDRGGLLFHISSRYFNLYGVLAKIAGDLDAKVAAKWAPQNGVTLRSCWIALTWDDERFQQLLKDGWSEISASSYPHLRTWTDDYSSALPILNYDSLWEGFTHFKLFK